MDSQRSYECRTAADIVLFQLPLMGAYSGQRLSKMRGNMTHNEVLHQDSFAAAGIGC